MIEVARDENTITIQFPNDEIAEILDEVFPRSSDVYCGEVVEKLHELIWGVRFPRAVAGDPADWFKSANTPCSRCGYALDEWSAELVPVEDATNFSIISVGGNARVVGSTKIVTQERENHEATTRQEGRVWENTRDGIRRTAARG